MGDDETGDGERREGGVHRLLSLHVEVRSSLVEDQDPGPAIERPREQHPLLLATGERRTPRCSRRARTLQETVILRDEGDLAAQSLRVPTVERLAVDQHAAAGGLVEPGDDLDEGRVAAKDPS